MDDGIYPSRCLDVEDDTVVERDRGREPRSLPSNALLSLLHMARPGSLGREVQCSNVQVNEAPIRSSAGLNGGTEFR